jgi:hypothetical protein
MSKEDQVAEMVLIKEQNINQRISQQSRSTTNDSHKSHTLTPIRQMRSVNHRHIYQDLAPSPKERLYLLTAALPLSSQGDYFTPVNSLKAVPP